MDWKAKYDVTKHSILFDGVEVGRFERIWRYGTFYSEKGIHLIVEEKGKKYWVMYDDRGNFVKKVGPYDDIVKVERVEDKILFKDSKGFNYFINGEGNVILEKMIQD